MKIYRARITPLLLAFGFLGVAGALAAVGCGSVETQPPASSGWQACTVAGQCLLSIKGCCGPCGPAPLSAFAGTNRAQQAAFQHDNCPSPTPCPKCATGLSPDFAAFCESKACTPIDVRRHPVSACATDADCRLRFAGCCEDCNSSPDQIIALSMTGADRYKQEACAPSEACSHCLAQYPAGLSAICGADKHCAVAQAPPCPADPPQGGAACADPSLDCEYGQDPRPACRMHATCAAGAWLVMEAKCAGLSGPGQDGCPTQPNVTGACPKEGLLCDLGGGALCACGMCAGGPCSNMPHWSCASPPGAAGCPAVLPDLGASCSLAEGTQCVYGVCGSEASGGRVCQGGSWKDEPVACPL
jgi:hypothetical protein